MASDKNINNQDKKRLEELISILNNASRAYYDEASEIMSNFEYDALYDELVELEKKTGIVMATSPTRNVGYSVHSELPKKAHGTKMLSLDKTKNKEELLSWLGNNKGILSWKLDGLTLVITYKNGSLYEAVTRGNGEEGEVVTDNAKTFKNLPLSIPYKGELTIRGEAVILYSDFDRINSMIPEADAKYKNPRNLCSGSLRQLDSRVTASRNIRFYAFAITESEGVDFNNSKGNQLKWLEEQGFEIVPYEGVNALNLIDKVGEFEQKVADFIIPSDGLVLALDDLKLASTLGATARFPRHSIAFKWEDRSEETVLRRIEWSPSRTGLLNPVALFDPVELEGTTVKRASVHNVNILKSLELGIGDTITVYKANMIIPQIADNLTRSGNLEIPKECPICKGNTELRFSGKTEILMCLNEECPAKMSGRFTHFVSREAMNIDGLSEQTILKFMGYGYIKSFKDIYELDKYGDEIKALEGFGKKSYEKLMDSIEKSRDTSPARLLYALGITGIGYATSSLISKYCHNKWNEIISLSEDELIKIDGIGSVIAKDFTKFFSNEENKDMVKELVLKLNIDEKYEEAGDKLQNKTFVITGDLEHFSNRKELKDSIEKSGGKVASSVSNNTDYLITNNPSSGSSKNKKARELGIQIITEEKIMEMLGLL